MLHLKNVKNHFFRIKLGSFKYISYICGRQSLSEDVASLRALFYSRASTDYLKVKVLPTKTIELP